MHNNLVNKSILSVRCPINLHLFRNNPHLRLAEESHLRLAEEED